MAQPSVIQFFNSRKRPAIDDHKLDNNNKLRKLDQDVVNQPYKPISTVLSPEVIKVAKKSVSVKKPSTSRKVLQAKGTPEITTCLSKPQNDALIPITNGTSKDLKNIKNIINKSARLDKLKESLARFKKAEEQLKKVEKKTEQIPQSPKLKAFASIEIEVNVSPQKISSPEKPYLSPKKSLSSVKRNLLGALSPQKASSVRKNLLNTLSPTKTGTDLLSATKTLQLPFKYRTLSELFRATEAVVQIMYNRKELISFRKLKPAVEEMVKRTFLERHLAQIKFLYPEAYTFTQGKEKTFGMRQTQWDIIVTPILSSPSMTAQILLDRRRHFHQNLIDKTKEYHNEFLLSLTPPMVIPKDKITRWHPEFDLEKVPDVELGDLPKLPDIQHVSGKEVMETARKLFNCNTRMNQALLALQEKQKTGESPSVVAHSVIKGIPKALLEKVRQKQAAKALISMTRTADKEKEVELYSRLPEIARLTRNLFVSEKKGVLELDVVMEKLGNSYRTTMNKPELEDHLRTISREVPGWLVFHKLRNSVFVKLEKNADLSLVLNKLEKLAAERRES